MKAVLFTLIICSTLANPTDLYAQFLIDDDYYPIDNIIQINKSPVKKKNDISDWEMQPYSQNGKWGFIHIKYEEIGIPAKYDSVKFFSEGMAAVSDKGKWGFINRYGKLMIPCLYDSVDDFENNFCFVSIGKKMGMVNKSGTVVIPVQYDHLYFIDSELISVLKDEKYGIYNLSGQQISPFRFEVITHFNEERAWVKLNGKWGIINKQGVLLTTPKYISFHDFTEGLAVAKKESGVCGFINKNGDEVIPFVYDQAEPFSEGLAAVGNYQQENKLSFSYINKWGQNVIANTEYLIEEAWPFKNGYAKIKSDNYMGLIDKKGTIIIPLIYEDIRELKDSMIAVKRLGNWGYQKVYFDTLLEKTISYLAISCRFEEASDFLNGLALVKSGDEYFINKAGEFVKASRNPSDNDTNLISPEYTETFSIEYINTKGEKIIKGLSENESGFFYNGAAPVKKEGKWGFINKAGTTIIPYEYDSVGSFNEGIASVKKNNKWGFIYQDGDTLTGCRFDYAYNFEKGVAIIKMNGKYGYIDKTGDILIPCQYDWAYTFKDSLAIIRNGTQFGFINKSGKLVIPAIYDDVFDFNDGLAPAQKNGLWGYIDKNGKAIIPFQYEWAGQFADGLAPVMKDGKYGYIERSGQPVIPFVYKYACPFNKGLALARDEEGVTIGLDSKGNELFGLPLRSAFYEDLAIIIDNKNKLGFINREGKTVIACQFDEAMVFREGLAAVAINKKWGFINKQGNVVIPLQFDAALFFNEGIAMVAHLQID